MKNGVPFAVALARHFGPDDLTIAEGDDSYADYTKNVDARNKDLQERRDADAQFEVNRAESDKAVLAFSKEQGLGEDETKEIMGKFSDILAEVFTGKVTKETLLAIQRAVKFEEAVKEASEGAELKDRNEKIVAEMDKKAAPKGDNIPHPSSGGEVNDPDAKKPSKIEQIVDGYNRKDVYK